MGDAFHGIIQEIPFQMWRQSVSMDQPNPQPDTTIMSIVKDV